MSSLSWKKAARLPGLKLSDDEKASPDWPDTFDFYQVAILQYPGDGTPMGGRRARDDRKALIAALEAAADNHEISIELLSAQVEAFKDVPVRRCPHEGVDKSVDIDPQAWRSIGGRFKTVPAGFETVDVELVSKGAFGRWLEDQGEPPSEHVRAWIGTTQAAPKTAACDSKQPKKMDEFLSLLERIEAAWMESGRGKIDRHQWPGRSKDLWILAGQLMPNVFGGSNPESFYRNYAKKAGLRFGSENGVAAVYAELLQPDAAIDQHSAA